jgi:CheY-like chemotaxis protein
VRRSADAIRIEVWDSGPGIAESDRTAIFEEFRRLDRGGSGLGLGLSIAERIARLLGHRLSMRSRLGHGSVFAIDVSVAVATDQEDVLPNEVIDVPPQRVLVVDNDRSVLAATAALLASWDFEVFTASEAESAQILAQREQPKLLVFDYHLDDGLTGLELRKKLAMRDPDVPCLIVTADHDELVRAAVLEAGCHLLHKPLKPLALRSLIARVMAANDAPH